MRALADMTARKLDGSFIHLGLGGVSIPQPSFDGMEWYESYALRNAADGSEGRLVSQYTFEESWDVWEMHPMGSEIVICTHGSMTLTQEFTDGRVEQVDLQQGEYAINPPGIWHTADVAGTVIAIFITAGEGTEHRPR